MQAVWYFLRKHHLRQHMNTHTGAKSIQCSHRKQTFPLNSDLMHHNMHTSERPFNFNLCVCTKAFSYIIIRKYHMESTLEEITYICSHAAIMIWSSYSKVIFCTIITVIWNNENLHRDSWRGQKYVVSVMSLF